MLQPSSLNYETKTAIMAIMPYNFRSYFLIIFHISIIVIHVDRWLVTSGFM
jgi:hypothetical protein